MSIRLVALDLDGTLLDSRKGIAPHTVAAIKEVSHRGVHVVLNTARPPRSVKHIHQLLELDTLTINYNGALIWDVARGTAVEHYPLTLGLPKQMIDAVRAIDSATVITFEILDRWHTDFVDERYLTETARLFQPDVIAPLAEFAHLPVTKLMLHGEPEAMTRAALMLNEQFSQHVGVVQTDPDLLQITHVACDKQHALQSVADHYNIPMTEVMAIGDNLNDIGMIQAAGVGVAMDNAHPLVKAAADWIAPSNDDHGVHAALVKYGLAR